MTKLLKVFFAMHHNVNRVVNRCCISYWKTYCRCKNSLCLPI